MKNEKNNKYFKNEQAGEGKLLGTDEDELINIFCTRSYPELRVVFDVYSRTHGDIEEAHNIMQLFRALISKSKYFN